jgi:hypothetical protein
MGKELEPLDMPPLTEEMHDDLRKLEKDLRTRLFACCDSYSLKDEGAAFEYVRTYAIKFFDCYYTFYSQPQHLQYREHKRPASEAFTLQRVVKCIEDVWAIHNYFRANSSRMARIKKTISEHAKSKPSILRLMAPPDAPTPWAPSMSIAPPLGALARLLPHPRTLLFQAYRAKFPGAGIMDICWAAR